MDNEHKYKPSHFNFINHHHTNNINENISIFPPINHEDLPLPPPQQPPQQPPLTINSDDHPSPPKKHIKNYAHLINWVNFALHFWHSKFVSFFNHFSCVGLVSLFRYVAVAVSILGVGSYWLRCRRLNPFIVKQDSVLHLKAVIQSKDEKILQLLEQIAHMNKVLLAHNKIPALKNG